MKISFKYALLVTLLIVVCHSARAQEKGIVWSAPETVSTSGNKSPRIGLLPNNVPAVIWGKSSTIYFSKKVNGVFLEPKILDNDGHSPDLYNFGGLDMAIRDESIFIVFENFSEGLFVIRSMDGGETFDLPVNIFLAEPGKWATLASIETDEEGNPMIAVIYENSNETNGQFILIRSLDKGDSYLDPVLINAPSDGDYVCECCPSEILTDADDVFVAYRNNNDNLRDIWVSKSTDNGASFDSAVDIDDTDWMLASCPISGPKLAKLSEDTIISAWISGADNGRKLYLSSFAAQNMLQGTQIQIPQSSTNAVQSNPSISIDGEAIVLVWQEGGFGDNGAEVVASYSVDGMNALLEQASVVSNAKGTQSYPDLTFNDGVYHLIYSDVNSSISYHAGEVGDLVNTTHVDVEQVDWQILKNPVVGAIIRIKYLGERELDKTKFQLYDSQGRLAQTWTEKEIRSEGIIDYLIEPDSNGLHFLVISNRDHQWLEKLIIAR